MKVLLVSFSELPTLQRHLYVLAEELTRVGVDVYTIGSNNLAIDINTTERNWLVETPVSPKPSLSSLFSVFSKVDSLVTKVHEINPDVVHFTNKHTWNYFLIKKIRKQLRGIKVLHTFHDPVGHVGDSVQNGVILYHKLVQRLLDGVVVHSDMANLQAKEQLKTKCPIFQIPLGEKPWRDYAPPSAENKEALIFGRLNPYKGLKYYPSILEELKRIDPSIHVTIAGKASSEVSEELLLEISNMPNCTLINSFIDEKDVDSYFSRACVVLVPYTSITQSGVILDAYTRSRPVVAFDIPGIAQYVPRVECLVKAFDCRSFALRVASFLNSSTTVEEVSHALWSYGKEKFSPSCMATSVKEVYLEVIGGR